MGSEMCIRDSVKAMQDRSTAAFKESLRSADMLLLDDVQFVGGKTSTQEELLSTLTALIEDGKRIVFSADRAPMALTEVEPRLRSHLAAGLTCPVEAGDRELKIAVAQNRLKALSAPSSRARPTPKSWPSWWTAPPARCASSRAL